MSEIISGFAIWILELVMKVVDVLNKVFIDVMLYFADKTLSLAVTVMNTLGLPLNWTPNAYLSAIPPEMLQMLGLLGAGDALKIIIGAITIRIQLQMIPFLRWGK